MRAASANRAGRPHRNPSPLTPHADSSAMRRQRRASTLGRMARPAGRAIRPHAQ